MNPNMYAQITRPTARVVATVLLATLLCAAALPARAAPAGEAAHEPEGVITLSSSATVEVPKDWMSVTFSVTREGVDAAAVQSALKEALGAALAQARKIQKEGDNAVDVQSGVFSLQPRYNAKGALNGWSGTTELTVQGRDMPAIAELVGHVGTMTIARLGYSLSREARARVEAQVSAQAISAFRAKAADYAKAFGYAAFALREVNVQTDASSSQPPRPMMMRAMAAPEGGEPLPVEAGKGAVTATVSGSVQMK